VLPPPTNVGGYDELLSYFQERGQTLPRKAESLATLDQAIYDGLPADLARPIGMFYGDLLTHTVPGAHWEVVEEGYPLVRITRKTGRRRRPSRVTAPGYPDSRPRTRLCPCPRTRQARTVEGSSGDRYQCGQAVKKHTATCSFGHSVDIAYSEFLYWSMTSRDSRERALGAVGQLGLAIAAVAVVLVIPRTNPIVEVALVMVLVSAVVIAAMAWRLVWGEGKKRQYVLTRERRKLIAAGLFAFLAIAAGLLMTIVQPGNPILALVCVVVAGQLNALFTTRAPSSVAAVNRA
jgi:hypothetical protein